MRRRPRGGRSLTAEQVVEVYDGAMSASLGASPEVRQHAAREALAEVGCTPLDVFRARLWIRAGKPTDNTWGDPGHNNWRHDA